MHTELKQLMTGKRILFIAPSFYHYSSVIVEKLRSYEATVDFFYERDVSIRHAIIDNFFKSKMAAWQERHYKKILSKIQDRKYDYLLVIRGYKMEPWFVDAVRKMNKGIIALLYQWDSIYTWECDYRHLIPAFDRVCTFDRLDAASLHLPYVPTFHTDEYASIPVLEKEYDFLFCTSYTKEKYEFMKILITYCQGHQYTLKTHVYISFARYLIGRLKGENIDYHKVAFYRLSRQKYADLFSKAKSIVDFSGTTQTGLTMRIVDAFGAGKRVITNNKHVLEESGYDPSQVVVFNTQQFSLPNRVARDEQFPKQDYSVRKWLESIFLYGAVIREHQPS